ncbi:hypothetical protein EKN06_12895 [Croceicoccus ponticola]|uniref:DUF4168 domain-containing protein n=1 Tax=Croceicoccus ponticola TaxID=2217664 RepID=A0A437GVJ2_9SPHN|nr:DUF4168 domain-containing protein [Croceicoccus ponticola]RVQ65817.1 hypothetical protein EKN06_12895 [Croceicoccus ponticola]
MKKLLTAATIVGALVSAPAMAEAPAAAAAAEVSADAATPITDAELDMFAIAATKVNDIAQDAALSAEAKQAAMVAAVQGSGLDPVKFNDIATKSQSDEAIKGRVAEAFARRPAPTPAPAATADAEVEAEAANGEQAAG